MKTLYVVRHGITEANKEKIYQSEASQLSQEGREQALILQKRFASISVEVIYTSPLPRAQETATIINELLRVEMKADDLLKEWKKPSSLIGKPSKGEDVQNFKKAQSEHRDNLSWKFEDEESMEEMRDRVSKFLEERKADAKDNILVVTHSVPLASMLAVVLIGIEKQAHLYYNILDHASTTNTGLTVFRLPDMTKDWKLITWNDYAHLGEI